MLEWAGGPYDPDALDPKAVVFDSPRKRWQNHSGETLPIGTLKQIERDLAPCLGKGWLKS
jgi:hypothetical protein